MINPRSFSKAEKSEVDDLVLHADPNKGTTHVDPKTLGSGGEGDSSHSIENPSSQNNIATLAMEVVGVNKELRILEVQVSEATCDSQEDKYKISLIRKFIYSGLRPHTDMIRDWITIVWKGIGPLKILAREGEFSCFSLAQMWTCKK